MKKILIIGKNSYIGTSFQKWMAQFKNAYHIKRISVRGTAWQQHDFSVYDTVIYLAAIVHMKKADSLSYYHVNRDLAVEVAKKAQKEQVKQFIFFSTMAVFGLEEGVITAQTLPHPTSDYGKSKLEAEKLINQFKHPTFNVLIIRPPMIYGAGAKGNYEKLSKIAQTIPFFPRVNNKRSMLYIENLNSFIKLAVDFNLTGTFHPQNEQLVNTSEMVNVIARVNNRRNHLIVGLDSIITTLSKKSRLVKKIFGNLSYDNSMVGYPGSTYHSIHLDYQEKDFIRSIEESEK